jgi:hypothetical protein
MPPLEVLIPIAIAALVLGALIGWLARSGQVRRHADDAQAVKLQLATAQATVARVPELEQRLAAAERDGDVLLAEKARLATLAERLKPAEDELIFLRGRVDALSSAKTKLEENQRNMEAAHAEKTAADGAARGHRRAAEGDGGCRTGPEPEQADRGRRAIAEKPSRIDGRRSRQAAGGNRRAGEAGG